MKVYENKHEKRHLQLIFKDGDVLHLRPGEKINIIENGSVVKRFYV